MKKWIATALAATMLASGAQAENFTYEVTFGEPDFVGGMGENGMSGRSGIMTGTYRTSLANGTSITGSIRCIGMDQPPNALFDVHFSCEAARSGGPQSSLIYGCNTVPNDGGFSCVGGIEGKTGELEGRRGLVTMHLKRGTSVGTGQWLE